MQYSPHALVLPFPAQGHVIPLMELSHRLLDHGFTITFVNTEFNHHRVSAALPQEHGKIHSSIRLVSIPDGLAPDEDRNDLGRLCEGAAAVMPDYLEEIIRKSDGGITWMIADENMGWALEVAKRTGIRAAAYWPGPTALLVTMMSIPKLVEDGVLSPDGQPNRHEMIKLSPDMPLISTREFPWNHIGNFKAQESVFHYINNNIKATVLAEFIICNSFYELELPVFTYMPTLLPVGALLTDKQSGHFWPEDAACIDWLDKQPAKSVVYVAFGSFTIFDKDQFQELALGLELSGRPFLWVVRPDLTSRRDDAYPTGFKERVGNRGMIVDWSPQQKVLAHPSVACFFSHCGWNSTIEGVKHGVPFLCYPYFCDQFLNQRYICDFWKIGLRMSPNDETGIISREKVKEKVEELLEDKNIKDMSLMWKEIANTSIAEGGSSHKNFHKFASTMKTTYAS